MTKIHHIALGAHDVARVARFYGEVFQLAETARHPGADRGLRSIWLDVGGGATLMIEQTDEVLRRVDGVGAGPFLLAFRVEPTERAFLSRRVVDAGGFIESRSEFSLYFRDPEGNRVAVSHFPLKGVEP